jgi:ABC-type transport system substrate-binding protein
MPPLAETNFKMSHYRSRGHIDFGEQFPYDPEKANALLKEAGFDQKNPLRYAIMTHAAEAACPTTATIMKTQNAKLGVELTYDFQGYIVENMMTTSVTSLPFLQAARASVKGYEHMHGFKIRFETTWLDRP